MILIINALFQVIYYWVLPNNQHNFHLNVNVEITNDFYMKTHKTFSLNTLHEYFAYRTSIYLFVDVRYYFMGTKYHLKQIDEKS